MVGDGDKQSSCWSSCWRKHLLHEISDMLAVIYDDPTPNTVKVQSNYNSQHTLLPPIQLDLCESMCLGDQLLQCEGMRGQSSLWSVL